MRAFTLALLMFACNAHAIDITQFGTPGESGIVEAYRCATSVDARQAPKARMRDVRQCYDLLPKRAAAALFEADYGPSPAWLQSDVVIVIVR